MNIIIVGCGKVGLTLAEQLCQENHAITLIDTDQERLDDAVNSKTFRQCWATAPAIRPR